MPYLLESIKNQPESLAVVINILGDIGDKSAIPALIKILQEEELGFEKRASAAEALQKLHAKEAIPVLIKALKAQPGEFKRHNKREYLYSFADFLNHIADVSQEDTKTKSGIIPGHYIFKGNEEDKAKAIQQWDEWLKDNIGLSEK